LRQTVWRFS